MHSLFSSLLLFLSHYLTRFRLTHRYFPLLRKTDETMSDISQCCRHRRQYWQSGISLENVAEKNSEGKKPVTNEQLSQEIIQSVNINYFGPDPFDFNLLIADAHDDER